jgi:hypothetical protein
MCKAAVAAALTSGAPLMRPAPRRDQKCNTKYILSLSDRSTVSGITDDKGRTKRIRTAAAVEIRAAKPLTAGEIEIATELYDDSVDYTKVNVHNGDYLWAFQNDNTAMTPECIDRRSWKNWSKH